MKVKQDNKNKLAELLRELTGVDINPNSIFDIQVLLLDFFDQILGSFFNTSFSAYLGSQILYPRTINLKYFCNIPKITKHV